jgi:hypothetical protein
VTRAEGAFRVNGDGTALTAGGGAVLATLWSQA